MGNMLLAGMGRFILPVPSLVWKWQILSNRKKIASRQRRFPADHRRVHHFVVAELPRHGKPLPPERISEALGLSLGRVNEILEALEKRLTFLFRNSAGAVVWAYPVTVDKTPHRITFSSGESLYAAWAIDAFATPFVQGRLRKTALSISVETVCAHCGKPMGLDIDSEMHCRVDDKRCRPLIFVPDIELRKLKAPNIIDAFWKESVFFWSEEHARRHRQKTHRSRGGYFTPEQVAFVNRNIQSALFQFW